MTETKNEILVDLFEEEEIELTPSGNNTDYADGVFHLCPYCLGANYNHRCDCLVVKYGSKYV